MRFFKRIGLLLFVLVLCFVFTSCSSMKNKVEKALSIIPEYLSDCDAQFNETENQLLISFGLQDKNKKYISSSGTAKIVITDKTNNKLYNGTITFDEKNFSDYTSKQWNGTRYLCGIYIDANKILPAANDEGTVELSVTAADKQAVFKTQKIKVFYLPTKEISVKKPKLPQKVSYYDFDNKETVISITNVDFKTEIISDYASVEVKATVKMIRNNLESQSDSFSIKCVMKDSKDVIVSSEEELCDYIKNGESTTIEFSFDELDANEKYKISFESINDSF